MEAATNHQSGSMRIRSLVVAAAVSMTVAALIALSAVTGVLPSKRAPTADEALSKAELKSSPPGACALCGTIESVRTVEVLDEASATSEAADSRSGTDTNNAGASASASLLDTLSGVVSGSTPERRKRVVYRVTLRMDDGSFRTISMSSPPAFTVGEKVRVVEGRLVRA